MAAVVVLACTAPVLTTAGYTCSRAAEKWLWLGSVGITKGEFVPLAGAVAAVLLIGAAFRVAIRMFYNR